MTASGPRRILNNRHFALVTAAFALFILYGSLVPLVTRPLNWDVATDRFAREMSKGVRLTSRSDFAANVLLFIPLGFLAAGAVTVDRRRPVAVLALLPAMAAFSAAIEFLQLWFPDRNTTINDVAAESLGGIVGLGAWALFGQGLTNRLRAAWAGLGPGAWAAKTLMAYLVFLVIVHGMPFDLSISPHKLKQKYEHGLEIDAKSSGVPTIAVAPWRQQLAEKTLLNIVYFLPAGALIAHLPGRRWRQRQSATTVLGLGFAIATAIEAVQLIVLSAGTYATDILSGALLTFAGWWLATRQQPIAKETWALAGVIWVAMLTLVFWLPFDLTSRANSIEWLPFADYYRGDYIAAFNRIANKLALFAPLGFIVVRGWHSTVSAAALIGLVIGAFIEFGQGLFSARSASTSDVLLSVAGATIGALVASRVAPRFEPTNHRS